jgi:hypothetical protein
LNDAFDGVDNRCLRNASVGEGGMNLGELVRVDVGISRPLGLNQKTAVRASLICFECRPPQGMSAFAGRAKMPNDF